MIAGGLYENRILFPVEEDPPRGGIISSAPTSLTLGGLEQLLAHHLPKRTWKDGEGWCSKVNLVPYIRTSPSQRIPGLNLRVLLLLQVGHHGLGAGTHMQFFEDVCQMDFDGEMADLQFAADFLVGKSLGQQFENFPLSNG